MMKQHKNDVKLRRDGNAIFKDTGHTDTGSSNAGINRKAKK